MAPIPLPPPEMTTTLLRTLKSVVSATLLCSASSFSFSARCGMGWCE
eukprot:CAMPEP_0119096516 /NCGR_PEP_ID=MMETSP1178-20130426/173102_1 /TAXON_ID=33656 /ORGANISM="unid sp, Strain CCMP2000" /LENGTH=46 /DNA_ID= /DNA_START= /DNA_END= /DNA_ORIENTATION=